LSVRDGARDGYEGPFGGIPTWLVKPVHGWLLDVLGFQSNSYGDGTLVSLLEDMEAKLRRSDFPGLATQYSDWLERWVSAVIAKHDLALDVVDELLRVAFGAGRAADRLEGLLLKGGSIWRVVQDGQRHRLERRVAPELRATAESIAEKQENAGRLIRLAWSHVYGRAPDASAGYREAVRAVEAASKPLFGPADSLYTLGKLLGSLKSEPWKWKIRYEVNEQGPDTIGALTHMVALLWTGQLDRHGTDDEKVQLHVSQDTAVAALPLAITLAQWFTAGTIGYDPAAKRP
jgi:hypothetical protein